MECPPVSLRAPVSRSHVRAAWPTLRSVLLQVTVYDPKSERQLGTALSKAIGVVADSNAPQGPALIKIEFPLSCAHPALLKPLR